MLEANKAAVRKFFVALGQGNAEQLAALLADDAEAICTGTSLMSGTRSHAEIIGAAGMLGQLAPGGIDFRILNLTAEADRVSAEVEGYSTLVNGKAYNNQYHFLFFLRDGKVARIREYLDTLLMENLLVPFLPKQA